MVKLIQAWPIWAERRMAEGVAPVMVSQTSALSKAKEMSEQWKAMGRPSRMGVCHWNQ